MSTITMTSATANKMLRQLNDEKDYLLRIEEDASTYIEAEGAEVYAPEYNYKSTAERIDEIDHGVCILKHAINQMNVNTEITVTIDDVQVTMTMDVALVRMAQLNRRANVLDKMRKRLPKTRREDRYGSTSNLVEYVCVNYDIETVKADYDAVMRTITEIQTQIDYVNQTVQFEVEGL